MFDSALKSKYYYYYLYAYEHVFVSVEWYIFYNSNDLFKFKS